MKKQIDWTKPIQTRDGRPVRVFATDLVASQPVLAAIRQPDGRDFINLFNADGNWIRSGQTTENDLMNVPKKVVAYVNVYPSGAAFTGYATRAEANRFADSDRIACVRIEAPEGQFDE